jgi:hypothetical protein
MTILSLGPSILVEPVAGSKELSSRPELRRSVVEGPAVSFPRFFLPTGEIN